MKKTVVFSALLMILAVSACAKEYPLERYSLMGSIKDGDLYGNISVQDLKKKGDFGLGGFSSFSGELILLDGQIYKVPFDGIPQVANDKDQATYAEFTTFSPSLTFEVNNISKDALLKEIAARTKNPNIFYSVKIKGDYLTLKYRTLVSQKPPYPSPTCAKYIDHPLSLQNQYGTILGFISPAYVNGGIDYPGSHLHFLSDDHRKGGHLYDFTIKHATVEIGFHHTFTIHLPDNEEFKASNPENNQVCPKQN